MRIMNALLLAFEVRNYPVTIGGGDSRQLKVVVGGEPITIYLGEDLNRTPKPLTAEQKRNLEKYGWKPQLEYDESSAGKLALYIGADFGWGLRGRWSDTARRPLELGLNSVLAAMAKTAATAHARRIERDERDRMWKERVQRRDDLIRRQEREKVLLTELDQHVSSWHRAQRIREYVAAVRGSKQIDAGSELDQWLVWANAQADRADPLVKSPHSVLDETIPSLYGD
jgi:hypothetical protein